MTFPDLNLLIALDVLLAEGSVASAARKLKLSPSAMSRTLARLREATGDPLLVRAGRGLVPTPRALELRERIGPLRQEAEAVLRPVELLDLARLSRTFVLRSSDGFAENFGPGLIARLAEEAPGVRLYFMAKTDKDSGPLRDGSVDLETGVVSARSSPELRVRALFRDRFVGVVRSGHPLCQGEISVERFAAGRHVGVSRRGIPDGPVGPVDEAIAASGRERNVAAWVSGFATALALAGGSDLIATVPERHTGHLRAGLHSFALPFDVPEITVSMLWHPRLDADPAHRWLRGRVYEVCAERLRESESTADAA